MRTGERFAAWVWNRRWLLALASAVITSLAVWQGASVGVDNSLRIWFLDDDPHLVAYRSFQERYGNDEIVVVAFQREDGMADGDGLRLLRRAETLLAAVDGVTRVVSIASHADAAFGEASEDDLRRRILADPVLRDRLISRDGTTAAIVAQMQSGDDVDLRRDRVLHGVEQALVRLGEPHHLAGIGVLYVALNRLSVVDARTLFGGAAALMFVLLWMFFRRLTPAILTVGTAVTAMLWTVGLMGAAGRSMNMVTSAVPTVILVVGVAEMVHILLHAASVPQAPDRRARAVGILGHMLRPCLLNVVTSAAGFAALVTAPLPAVRDLGLFTAAGLLGGFALTVLGATFALAAPGREPRPGGLRPALRTARWLCGLGMRRPVPVLAVVAATALIAVAAGSRVIVDTSTLEFLSSDHPVRRDSALIEARLAPFVPMEFLVRSPGDAETAELQAAIGRWQRAGERLPGVGWSHAPGDDALAGGDPEPRADVASPLRVTFSVRMQSSKGVDRTMRALLAEARLPDGATVEPAGYLPLYVRMTEYVVESQISGFAVAFAAVFGVIALAFRSVPIALLAVPSNLLPLLVMAGVMGAVGIRLDVATVTIATVVLGLIVDDTVHFLHRLRAELARCDDAAVALLATVDSAGQAILVTAAVMTLGFSVFALAEVRSLVHFGLLIALASATSVLTDLVVIPALVMLRRRPC